MADTERETKTTVSITVDGRTIEAAPGELVGSVVAAGGAGRVEW